MEPKQKFFVWRRKNKKINGQQLFAFPDQTGDMYTSYITAKEKRVGEECVCLHRKEAEYENKLKKKKGKRFE